MDAPLLALGVESAFGECCDNRPFHPPTGYATWRSGGQPRRRTPVRGRQPSKNRSRKGQWSDHGPVEVHANRPFSDPTVLSFPAAGPHPQSR